MQQSITTEKISLLACITVGCGISLYIMNQYGHSLLHWLTSFYRKLSGNTKNNSIDRNNLSSPLVKDPNLKPSIQQQNPSLIPIPKMTLAQLDQSVIEFSKKQNQIKDTTDLHRACQDNDIEKVKLLLQISTIDINAKRDCITFVSSGTGVEQQRGETPLHIACKASNKEIVEILLTRNGIDITIQNKDGDTPLHIACKIGNQEIVQQLLTYNASNIDKQNDKRETAISLSYLHKHEAIVALLCQNDVHPDSLFLSFVSESDYMDMIKRLLHKNIKLDNNRLLYIACQKGYSDAVILLLKHNTNNCMKINDKYCNPLFIACEKIKRRNIDRTQFVTIIKALLNDPAIDINIKDQAGCTVLHYVASDCELLQLFLERDCSSINAQTKSNGCPPVNGTTPLHNAIEGGNLEAILLLLQYGADISIKNCHGETPLVLACREVSWEKQRGIHANILEQLLESKFVTKEIIDSSNCLCRLNLNKKETNTFVLNLLLEYGADPNKIEDKYDLSPLLKVAGCNLPLLNLFIDKYNGDITQKNSANRTVWYIAFMSRNITNPNKMNFFNKLTETKKNEFMQRELSIVANFTPKNIFMECPYNKGDEKKNHYIQRFNSFIATCIKHGYIDLTVKINGKILLDVAYENLQERNNNFSLSEKNQKKCMHFKKNICCYNHDEWRGKNYNGCDDCKIYVEYNELIVHGLIQHVEPTTSERIVDKEIARTYEEKPAIYYSKTTEEKKIIKQIMASNFYQ
jgi:ankyrin repeat protein